MITLTLSNLKRSPNLHAACSTNPQQHFDSTNPKYGWTTRGDRQIAQGQAGLGESDRTSTNFAQSCIILQGAK